jgi:tRNA threonylcarbamoyladenosine biosynthesis protein TsaB
MKLLAFETATEACSVALLVDGDVRERFEIAPRRHAELALPWAEGLLADAGIARSQLDAVAVGRGPGAFTGVRLAISLAQGIALALDRPVVPAYRRRRTRTTCGSWPPSTRAWARSISVLSSAARPT